MKKYFALTLTSVIFLLTSQATFAAGMGTEKRTDGAPGSEYADFGGFEGQLSFGAEFGALLPTAKSGKSSFAVGVDADYRPYELFGARLAYFQAVQSPINAVINVTPLMHTQISNLHPFIGMGPGIAIVTLRGKTVKFAISGVAGADVDLFKNFSIGLTWNYHFLVGSYDLHGLAARFSLRF